jgi:hypothetical protein
MKTDLTKSIIVNAAVCLAFNCLLPPVQQQPVLNNVEAFFFSPRKTEK